MFNVVSISVFFTSEIEAVTTAGVFQRVQAVDEKDGVVNVVFLANFSNKRIIKYLFVIFQVLYAVFCFF